MAETPRAIITKLNNENYESWKYKVELLLIKEGLWDLVSGSQPAVPDAAWTSKDAQARATIGLLVEDNQLVHIRGTTTAAETWSALKDYHLKASLSSKVILLKTLCGLKLTENGNMEEHIINMSVTKDKLEAIGENIKEELFIAMLLGSLPESYNSLITALESRPEKDLTISLVKGKLVDEYRRRMNNFSTTDESQDKALRIQNGKGYKKGKQDGATECYFCKKKGHMKKECRKYKAWKEKSEKANKVTDNDLCFNVNQNECTEDYWYIDSGATSHMTNNRKFFDTTFKEIDDKVTIANGEEVKVKGCGSGKIKCVTDKDTIKTITLKNVLYVPELYGNLISVKRITEYGLKLEFKEKECNIIRGSETLVTAECTGNLYKLRTEHIALASMNKHNSKCIHTWHRKLGHRDPDAIRRLEKENMVYGVKIQECGIKEICEECIQGKMCRKPFPKMSSRKTKEILEIVHSDVCGPMQTITPGGKRYVLTMIDDFSGYTEVYLLAHKSEVFHYIKTYVEATKVKFNKMPIIIRSDRGKEYVNNQLRDYLEEQGIRMELTAPYSPQQNGKAERKNRYLVEMARCMLIDSILPKKYWGEAIITANYLQNRLPTKRNRNTPYEEWHSQKPNLKNTHIFGCEVYAHIPDEQRRKLEKKAKKLYFVGYSDQSKAYRLLDKETNKITISRDIIFLDNKLMEKELDEGKENNDSEAEVDIGRKGNTDITTQKETQVNEDEIGIPRDELNELQEEANSSKASKTTKKTESPVATRSSTRRTKGIPPSKLKQYASMIIDSHDEPNTIEEALTGSDKHNWKKALDDEYESMINNNTWELTEIPKDTKIIGCKWIFKFKRNENGNIIRYKARLVAQGYNQEYGIDYHEVFAAVVRQTTLRILLTIAGRDRLKIRHYDIKNAFLNGDLTETIYMEQPKGYEIKGKEQLVLKLNKSIYGLKQSANVWNKCISNKLKESGYVQSKTDPCLYTKQDKNVKSYIIIYVDDILIACTTQKELSKLRKTLSHSYNLTDLGNVKEYSGIQIETDNKGNQYIHQQKHIEQIVKTYGLQDAKGSTIPLSVGYESIEDDNALPNNKKFQSLIGSLMYIATSTRPDITASLTILSRKMINPTETDWLEAKRVARYLKSTANYRLKLYGNVTDKTDLIGYVDANWAESKADRKSNSGYVFKYHGACVSWACRKQSCVALSSTEAEYIALSDGCQEMLWLMKILKDFQEDVQLPVKINEDNQSCIKLVSNQNFSKRSKHIDTKYHFVRDLNKEIGLTNDKNEDDVIEEEC